MSDFQQNYIKLLIQIYGLEVDRDRVDIFLVSWYDRYESAWIFKAIVESLYRGRYKIVSVDNILKDWHRIGQPRYHFTPEYEWEIVHKIPEPTSQPPDRRSRTNEDDDLSVDAESLGTIASVETASAEEWQLTPKSKSIQPRSSYQHLNPEESAPFQSHKIVADTKSWDDAKTPHRYEYRHLPGSPGTRQQSVVPSNRSQSELERIVTQPCQRKLFDTLRAIVDPKNQQDIVVHDESMIFSPFAVGNRAKMQVAHLRVALEPIGEERLS
jgi:hypothetical protein